MDDVLTLCAVCGPPRYAEMRINISQAFNGIGTVVAPVLGSYVFFLKTQDDTKALKNVQWVYLAIACFVFLLAVVFYLYVISPFPFFFFYHLRVPARPFHFISFK